MRETRISPTLVDGAPALCKVPAFAKDTEAFPGSTEHHPYLWRFELDLSDKAASRQRVMALRKAASIRAPRRLKPSVAVISSMISSSVRNWPSEAIHFINSLSAYCVIVVRMGMGGRGHRLGGAEGWSR